MNMIVETLFGSRLYGLSTPDSDYDVKGVFSMPLKEVLWDGPDNVYKSETSSFDRAYYSLTKFLKMALKNDMVSFDMLHAPKECWMVSSFPWQELVDNRYRFYSKRMLNTLGMAENCLKSYENNKDVSFKNWSHALRVCWQWADVVRNGFYTFPLDVERRHLCLDVKLGKYDPWDCYSLVRESLRDAQNEIKTSDLPDHPDEEFAREFVYSVYI